MKDLTALKACKLLVLDVGGVLRDSKKALHWAYEKAFTEAGIWFSFNVKVTWNLRGLAAFHKSTNAIKAMLACLRANMSLDDILKETDAKVIEDCINKLITSQIKSEDETLVSRLHDRYKVLWHSIEAINKIKIYPKTSEALEKLRTKFRLAIFSNSHPDTLKRDLVGLEGFFEILLTNVEVGASKPDGKGIRIICDRLGIKPSETAYIGDTPVDIIASRDAGCMSVVVCSGMSKREWLEQSKPDYVFDDLRKLAQDFQEK
jgi:HAD superfamily hydrolase (TIGR01549 family)